MKKCAMGPPHKRKTRKDKKRKDKKEKKATKKDKLKLKKEEVEKGQDRHVWPYNWTQQASHLQTSDERRRMVMELHSLDKAAFPQGPSFTAEGKLRMIFQGAEGFTWGPIKEHAAKAVELTCPIL